MWNARGFEFGAVLFLATIYPGTLLPVSIYALIRALSAVLLSPKIGHLIDSSSRLPLIRLSILGQRIAVVASCAIFLVLFHKKASLYGLTLTPFFILLVLLACMEKLCSILNTIAIERDWVVVIAAEDASVLENLNAQMRRIDLSCKMLAPLAVALLDGWSASMAVWMILITNTVSVGIEYPLLARTFRQVPSLGETRLTPVDGGNTRADASPEPEQGLNTSTNTFWGRCFALRCTSLGFYMRQSAFLPSLALSILYLTVLSFSGQMITFLLALTDPKISSTSLGLLRTLSTVSEISSTFIAPRVMSRIGAVRAGIWFLSWQAMWLSSAVGLLWVGSEWSSQPSLPVFILGVILSRFGLWSFDLCAQLIIQESVLPAFRGSFSAVEASLQNFFEICAFATTVIFPEPEQFRYPAIISLVALYSSAAFYAKFVRDQRGHLLHIPICLKAPAESRVQDEAHYQSLPAEVE